MKQFYFSVCILSFTSLVQAQCPELNITSANGPEDPICSGSQAILAASGDGQTVAWFATDMGGTALSTGEVYNTAPLSVTTSFWAEAQTEVTLPAESGGAKPAKTSNGGSAGGVNSTPWGLSFTVTQKFVLNSVDVYLTSSTPGTIVIQLNDENYQVIDEVSIDAPAGGTNINPVVFTVPLGFTISPGTYRLLAPIGHPAMNRDLAAGGFPFPIGTVGSVTGGTIDNNPNTNVTTYYFFYNWNYSPITTCSSEREEVIVAVNPTPGQPSGDSTQLFEEGTTLADLDVTGTNLSWYSDSAATTPLPDSTPVEPGVTYYVNQTVDGCTGPTLAILVEAVASVSGQDFSNFSYYPNPVKNKVTLNNSTGITAVTAYNIQGQTVLKLMPDAITAEIDFSTFSGGVYLLKVEAGQSVKTIRIVKQ